MKHLALALTFGLSFSGLASASALQLRSVHSNGSGCPVAVNASIPYGFDGEWLTFDLQRVTDMQVARGSGISLEESRRQCAFTLDMKAAPGYRYALERVVVWGQAQLAMRDQLLTSTDAFFAGNGETSGVDDTIQVRSGRSEPFTSDQWISGQDQVWSDCRTDRSLTVNTSLRIASENQARYASYSAGEINKVALRFVVQKCR